MAAIDPSSQQIVIGAVVVLVVVILVCCIFAPWRNMGAQGKKAPVKDEPEQPDPPPMEDEEEGEGVTPPTATRGLDQSTRMQNEDVDEKRQAELHRQALMLPSGRRRIIAAPTTGALVMASMRSRDGSGGRKLHNPGAGYDDTSDMSNVEPASVGNYLTTL